jgi:mannose-1-phosphate guanylyltransferase
MLHVVIMAGGSGTRFWPESREDRPKQLLKMVGDRTMLRATVDRLGDLAPPQRIIIATTQQLAGQIAAELPELPPQAILAEPCKRNTAPCIGLAALQILRHDPDAIMAVLPADHLIEPEEVFRNGIRYAASLVEADPSRIITFGIRPTYAAESFGYIERGEPLGNEEEKEVGGRAYSVKRFHEKPKAETAQQYIDAGRFYWNSGIFLWKAQTIFDALARYEPPMHEHLRLIGEAANRPDAEEVLRREFAAIRGVSIDYAVMERAANVAVVEATFAWDDVGSWQAMARVRGADDQGNTIAAKHLGLDTTGTIIRGTDDHLIVTLGLKDCLIVHTPDATLVADKHQEESIRRVVELLKERGWEKYL